MPCLTRNSPIEQRAVRALDVVPTVESLLETRHGIGGCSFIQFGGDPAVDDEMYIDVHLGAKRLTSPDARLDAIINFVAHAPGSCGGCAQAGWGGVPLFVALLLAHSVSRTPVGGRASLRETMIAATRRYVRTVR